MSSISESSDLIVDQATPGTVDETARANLYLVLSRAFHSPVEMCEEDPIRMRIVADALPGAISSMTRDLAGQWERALATRQELSLAYARLFLGPLIILAPPYASFYLEPDQRLMGPVSQSVAEAYVEAGLEPGPGPREAPDHVSLEWEYLYFVTHQHLVTGDARWLDRRGVFIAAHLSRWMPSLADAVKSAGIHPFYDKLSSLLTALLKDPHFL